MRLLLLSNSTQFGRGYLDHAEAAVVEHLEGIRRLLFIPFALRDRDAYAATVRKRFAAWSVEVDSLHEAGDPRAAVEAAQAVFTGGGNTFRLLKSLQERELVGLLHRRIGEGLPYMGASAGTNIAGPTIRTTNDMPIVEPASFDAIDVIPFQINPHYLDPTPGVQHMGETRETRLFEYLEENSTPVVGLREGGWLVRRDGELRLMGERPARIFRPGVDPEEVDSPADLSPLLHEG